jgi:hypothetical protein
MDPAILGSEDFGIFGFDDHKIAGAYAEDGGYRNDGGGDGVVAKVTRRAQKLLLVR